MFAMGLDHGGSDHPRYAPQADHNDEATYIAALKHAIDTWHGRQIVVS